MSGVSTAAVRPIGPGATVSVAVVVRVVAVPVSALVGCGRIDHPHPGVRCGRAVSRRPRLSVVAVCSVGRCAGPGRCVMIYRFERGGVWVPRTHPIFFT